MVVVYKNMVGLGGLAHWVTLQHYFSTTLLNGCRPLVYTNNIHRSAGSSPLFNSTGPYCHWSC